MNATAGGLKKACLQLRKLRTIHHMGIRERKFIMAKKNVAIIGYGGMGGWHASYIQKSDVVQLVGIYDINPARCEAAVSHGIHAYPSLEALLADPAVDLVVIATPNNHHHPLALAALAAGKHILCEKPVAMSSAELSDMIEAANKAGRIFTVHQNRRWDEDWRTVKHMYDNNTLGKTFRIESRVHGSRGIPGDWRNQKEGSDEIK